MKAMKSLTFLILLFSTSYGHSQASKIAHLPKSLKEISGLEHFTDSTLLAINDGGNDACIYEITFKGKIIREITVNNAKNIDWEDLAIDEQKEYLYIGDFGNNTNERKTLSIYKIAISDLTTQHSVNAKKIDFSYPEQTEFPANKKNKLFDCEAMAIRGDKIYLFTKSNTKPYRGISLIYSMTTTGKNFRLEQELNIGNKGYFQNSITAADYFKGKFYLSSYSYLYIVVQNDEGFSLESKISYNRLTQKESLVVISSSEVMLADEQSPLGVGRNLYSLKLTK